MKNFFRGLIFLMILGSVSYVLINYYSFIFAKTVIGQITNIEKVANSVAIVGGSPDQQVNDKALFSVALLIKDSEGKFWTASSEDRQWGIVERGTCLQAKLFPYAPWDFDKGSTYFNARLISVLTCEDIGFQTPVPTSSNQ